ncbi:MAG TPA: ATP-binding protein [Actinomycetota bacterium]|nr:ATP-binding protein [Actinomycetota bacterium]
MSLIIVLIVALTVASLMGALRRRRQADRWRREEEERRRRQSADQPSGVGAGGPFGAMFPFGGLFDLLSGSSTWSRSYAWDEATGQWVEITDDPVREIPPPQQTGGPTQPQQPEGKRRSRPQRRQSRSGGLFGGLLGGMDGSGELQVEAPDTLTTFEDVGGMEELKAEIRDTVGLVLKHPDDAERFGIRWNGILLHGPPGVGKSFFARAIAGEYALNLIHVSTGDLVSSLVGGSARNIDKASTRHCRTCRVSCSSTSSTPSLSGATRRRTRSRGARSTSS